MCFVCSVCLVEKRSQCSCAVGSLEESRKKTFLCKNDNMHRSFKKL